MRKAHRDIEDPRFCKHIGDVHKIGTKTMNAETKICQNCKGGFTIEPEDFQFYEKIKVPPPTWCPECRMVRRMVWRNIRALYRNTCRAPGHEEEVISIFTQDSPFIIYDQKYWWSDAWDPLLYGRPYDFSRSFFEQYRDLFLAVPHPNLSNKNPVGTDYSNMTVDSKNCYLIFSSTNNEECIYVDGLYNSKNCISCTYLHGCEYCYECIGCDDCYRIAFSQDCISCLDSMFLFDCRNCRDCFGCWNLRNKQYYIFNKKYSKEDYQKELSRLFSGSFTDLRKQLEKFSSGRAQGIRRFAQITNAQNVTGDYISHAKNCVACFDVANVEDAKYCSRIYIGGSQNYDITVAVKPELTYECAGGGNGYDNSFCSAIMDDKNLRYSHFCFGSHDLFGCAGLRNKSYCILNKQYTKEEYETLVPKIIRHMNEMPYVDSRSTAYGYGEFFPQEISAFGYNESMAAEYFPLTKEEALKQGYRWRDPDTKQYTVTKTPDSLPDHIKDTDDSILKETIGCMHQGTCNEQCTTAFRIIPEELSFYRRMNLPVPRLCPNCRHYERLKQRNPLKLWHRRCACLSAEAVAKADAYENTAKHFHADKPCPNEFETSYAPERKELVYCEQCYNAEVA